MSRLSELTPHTIKVGCYTYTVEIQDEKWRDKNGAYGLCDLDSMVITIADVSCAESYINTLIHEILHAAYHLMGLYDRDNEEKTVNALSTALTMIMKDNSKLVGLLDQLYFPGTYTETVRTELLKDIKAPLVDYNEGL